MSFSFCVQTVSIVYHSDLKVKSVIMIWNDGYDSYRDPMGKMEKKDQQELQDLLWVFWLVIHGTFMAIYIFCVFWLVEVVLIAYGWVYFIYFQGIAGKRGEQGPPGLTGFQVCPFFLWLCIQSEMTLNVQCSNAVKGVISWESFLDLIT